MIRGGGDPLEAFGTNKIFKKIILDFGVVRTGLSSFRHSLKILIGSTNI